MNETLLENPLLKLQSCGQSVWLDLLSRTLITLGELKHLIEDDGLRGVTSNPAIFEKSMGETNDYDDAIAKLSTSAATQTEIYEALAIDDVRAAADLLRPTYETLNGADGFVSLEVSPHLAHDSVGSVEEARRLWAEVNRPNLLIKIPGTKAGLRAIQQCLAEGINVNVTLLFGLDRYRKVAEAYLAALETRVAQHLPVERIASVASFFLSRIDTLVDKTLGESHAPEAEALQGQAAIASAKLAYKIYQEIAGNERFRKLAQQKARPQRVLWASTSTKNPAYNDVKYIEPLIGPDTITTVPLETLKVYRDHGRPVSRLTADVDEARAVFARLAALGIDMNAVAQQLEDEGVQKFIEPFDLLMTTLREKCSGL